MLSHDGTRHPDRPWALAAQPDAIAPTHMDTRSWPAAPNLAGNTADPRGAPARPDADWTHENARMVGVVAHEEKRSLGMGST